ncbi:MAG TPA: hypothetical protein VF708_04760 [Pyrinomonadaceae bacterium]
MRLSAGKKSIVLLASLVLILLAAGRAQTTITPPPLPNPVLIYTGAEFYEAGGKEWTRYRYMVTNLTDYPNEMFAAAPNLPPCGKNVNASRTWVDIYEDRGQRLNGFCALGDRDGLGQLWFALERDAIPPSWVYIEMNDRQTNTKYKSNIAATSE